MKKIATTTLVGLAIALSTSDLSAQVCNGMAPFSAGKMRVGVDLQFPTNATTYGAHFAVGNASGLFGAASLGLMSPSGGGDAATMFGINGGKDIPVGAKKNISACPQLFFNGVQFPNSAGSTNSFGAGATFGTSITQTSFDLVPFGGAQLHRDSFSSGGFSASDTNLDLVGGVGFVLSKVWTVRPMIVVPLTNNGDAVFGVSGAMSFGGPAK
jgi:hypothetical protein